MPPPWPPEMVEKVRTLVGRGLKQREIAAELGVPWTGVKRVMHRYHIRSHHGQKKLTNKGLITKLLADGLTDRQVAARLGVARGTIQRARSEMNIRSKHRLHADDVKRLLADGLTTEQIGSKLGATPGSVGTFCCRNKIKLRGKRGSRLAAKYNLPADLRPGDICVLTALSSGPMTAAQIDNFVFAGRPNGGNLTLHRTGRLVARGLVFRFDRWDEATGKRCKSLFTLTGKALDLFCNIPDPPPEGDSP